MCHNFVLITLAIFINVSTVFDFIIKIEKAQITTINSTIHNKEIEIICFNHNPNIEHMLLLPHAQVLLLLNIVNTAMNCCEDNSSSYPGIIYTRYRSFRFVKNKKSCQVCCIGSNNYHSKASPHHS